MAPKS